jgi:hypothetical protein
MFLVVGLIAGALNLAGVSPVVGDRGWSYCQTSSGVKSLKIHLTVKGKPRTLRKRCVWPIWFDHPTTLPVPFVREQRLDGSIPSLGVCRIGAFHLTTITPAEQPLEYQYQS